MSWLSRKNKQAQNTWVTDAEWAKINQEPLKATNLLYLIVVSLILATIWAAWAEIDERTLGNGKVIPSSKLQTLQSLDGGMVHEILVREGQLVNRGDVLVKVDPTRFMASFAENKTQHLNLIAEVNRLHALVNDEPLKFAPDLKEQPEIIRRETQLFQASKDELFSQQEALRNVIVQKREEYREAQVALQQYEDTLKLTEQELRATRPLLEFGAVSEIDILRLEKEIVRVKGEVNRTKSSSARSQAAIKEAESKQQELRLTLTNKWRNELQDSHSKLDALTSSIEGFEDKVVQADIKSPIQATVQKLHINTIGGVISPGGNVVDLVPLNDKLLVEAKISPKDIPFIKKGQKAIIKFAAYDFTIYGGTEASVSHISSDTITDEKDETYYLVNLSTDYVNLNQDLLIIPGMTAQVDILTGKRTVLEYLLKPIVRAKSNALHER